MNWVGPIGALMAVVGFALSAARRMCRTVQTRESHRDKFPDPFHRGGDRCRQRFTNRNSWLTRHTAHESRGPKTAATSWFWIESGARDMPIGTAFGRQSARRCHRALGEAMKAEVSPRQ